MNNNYGFIKGAVFGAIAITAIGMISKPIRVNTSRMVRQQANRVKNSATNMWDNLTN